MGWFYLAAMIITYGVANYLQAAAATREEPQSGFHPRLLLRLAAHKTYLTGVAFQTLGFILAIFARADLPLFLVQAAVAAGLGVTAVLGVIFLHWKLARTEVVLLVLLSVGVGVLVVSAKPSISEDLDTTAILALAGSWVFIAVAGWFAARKLHGAAGSVALGALAGLGFGAASVASRPLAGAVSLADLLTHPLLYLIIVLSLTGQLLLALAMQRGSTTSAVAAMDAAFAAPAAAVGLLLLGDQIRPGMEPLAVIGFVMTLGAVLALGRYAEPQQHHPSRVARPPGEPPAESPAAPKSSGDQSSKMDSTVDFIPTIANTPSGDVTDPKNQVTSKPKR